MPGASLAAAAAAAAAGMVSILHNSVCRQRLRRGFQRQQQQR
jgi:hypothetical protein